MGLPNKWKVKWTPEVGEYYAKQSSDSYTTRSWDYLKSHNGGGEIINGSGRKGASYSASDNSNLPIITIEQFREFINPSKTTEMKLVDSEERVVYQSRVIEINGLERDVTICVAVSKENGQLYGGYAVLNPKDEKDWRIAKLTAKGRALNERTNLLKFESLTYGVRSKEVLRGIIDQLFSQFKKGKIVIKGVV